MAHPYRSKKRKRINSVFRLYSGHEAGFWVELSWRWFVAFVMRWLTAHMTTWGFAGALCLGNLAAGQTLDNLLVFNQVGNEVVLAYDGMLYKTNVDKDQILPYAPFPSDSLFAPNTKPASNSGLLTEEYFWLWDSSIGSIVRYDREGVAYITAQNPTLTRFSHVAAAHPQSGNPLVFGGYGFYRAKDFFIEFDADLGEWREVPSVVGEDDPPPSMRGRLLALSDSSTVVFVGGVVSKTVTMPLYNELNLERAWAFDTVNRRWARLPIDDVLHCLLRESTMRLLKDFRGYESVFVGIHPKTDLTVCTSAVHPEMETGTVFLWHPASNRYAILETRFEFNTGIRLTALTASDDSLTIHQVGLDRSGDTPLVMKHQTRALDASITWRMLELPGEPIMPPHMLGLLVLLIGITATGAWRLRTRKGIWYTAGDTEMRVRNGLTESIEVLPPNAREILTAMASKPPGTLIMREDLEKAFDGRAYSMDTLRTVMNRAISAVNDVGEHRLGKEIIQRIPSPEDKRRQVYVLAVPVRLKGKRDSTPA
jgi:hypothetical protein